MMIKKKKTCSVCGNPCKTNKDLLTSQQVQSHKGHPNPPPHPTLPPYVHRKLNLALTTPILLVWRLENLGADRNKCSKKHGELVKGLHPDAQRQPKESKSQL